MDTDEVSGRRSSTQCAQCEENGQLTLPSAFCVDCQDFLCRECINMHRQFRATRDHTLLEKENLPKQTPTTKVTEKCTKHPDRMIALYCPSHDTLGCLTCFKEDHATCPDTGIISELSGNIEKSEEFTEVRRMAQQHAEVLDSYRQLIQDYHNINNNCYDESVEKFQSFRSEIEASLDALGEKVLKEAIELKRRNKNVLDSLLEEMTSLAEGIQSFTSDIELKQRMKQNDNLFIAVKTNKNQIKETGQKLDRLKKEMHIKRYRFSGNPSIKHILNTTCITESVIGEGRCTADINIKSPDDEVDCFVTGIVKISATDIVVADHTTENKCLKQINVVQNTLVHRRTLDSLPVDVTTIPESRIAVTMPALHQIWFFSLDGTLTPCGTIDVDGRCLAMECTGDRLVVSYHTPGKVQMIDLQGKVLMTVTSDAAGNPLFESPWCLSVSSDHRSIYVSEKDKHTVTCLDMDGTVNWIYQAEDLKCPQGLATGPGTLYICSAWTHSLQLVSPRGGKLDLLPLKQFNISFPQAIHYCREEESLYVSSGSTYPQYGNFIRRLTFK